MHRFLTDKQTECVKSMHWNKSEEEKETRHFHQHAARRPRGRPRKNSLIFSSNTTLIPSTNKQKGAKRGRPCLNRINRAVQKNRKLKSLTSQIITPSHERFSKLKLKYSHKKKEIKHTTKETNKNTSFDFGSCKIAFSKYLLLNVAMIDNKDLNTDRKLNKMFPNIFCKFPRIFLEKIDLKLKDEKGIIDHRTLNGCSDKTSEIEIPQETQKLDDGIQDENFVLKGNKSIDNTRLTTDRNFLTKLGTERTLENLPDFSHHSAIDTDHTRFSNAHFRTVHVDLTNLKMKLKSFDISKYKTRKSYEDKIVSSTSQNQLELHDKNSKEGQSDSDGSNTNVIDRKMFSSETDDKSNERSDEIETPFLTQDREIISSETEAKSNECLDETETPVLTQELREELEVNNESCTLLVPPVLERECAKECLFLDSVSATNDVKKDSLDTLQRTVETTNTELDSRMSACVLPIHSETETSYLKLHSSNSNKDKQEETSADNIVQNPEQDLNVLKAETIVGTECGDLDSSNIVAELKYAQPSYINTRENNLVKGQKYHVTVPLNYCHRNHSTNEHLGTNETENILLADIENNAKNSNKPGKHNHLSKVDHVSKKTDSSSKHQNADESRERTKSRSRSQSCDKGYDSDATVIYDDDVGSNESLALDKSYIDPNSVLSMQEFSPKVNDYVLSYKPNIGEWSEVEAYQQKLHKTFMRHCDELRFREVYRNENFRSETEGVIPIPSTVSLIMQDQTSTIKPKLIDGRKRGFKNPSFRRHLFGLKKSKASRTTAITVLKKHKRRRTISATSNVLYKKRTIKPKDAKNTDKSSSFSTKKNRVSHKINNSLSLKDKHNRTKISKQRIGKDKEKQLNNINKHRIGFYAMKRKTRAKQKDRTCDVIRRVEEIFPNTKTSSQSDGEDLPTILPPKRRRQHQKPKAMIYKSVENSTNGMERLIQEFPRHNWLENKYSTGEVSSNDFDDDFKNKKMSELKNLEKEQEQIEKENKDNSDTEDTDMVVSTTTSLSDCNDCYDVGSLPLIVANMENGVNVSNDNIDTDLHMENDDSLHYTEDMIGDSASQETNQKPAGSRYNQEEAAEDEPHSTLDAIEPDTAINQDNNSNESQRNEEFTYSSDYSNRKDDTECHTLESCVENDSEKIPESIFGEDNTQEIRKSNQQKLPPVPSLIPVSVHKRKSDSCDDKPSTNSSSGCTVDLAYENNAPSALQHAFNTAKSKEELIEKQHEGYDRRILSIGSVLSDFSEPPNKIPCLGNPILSEDTRYSLSSQLPLSEQLDSTMVTPHPLLINENGNSTENANLQYEFEKHLKEFKQLELLAERKARERELLLDLQRQKAELIQKLGLEGLNLARADTKGSTKNDEKHTNKSDIARITTSLKSNIESNVNKDSFRKNGNRNTNKDSSPPQAHQSKTKTSLDLITKLDTSVYSIPPHIKASCPFIARKTAIVDPPGNKEITIRNGEEIPKAHCQAPFETPGRLIFPLPSFCIEQQKFAPFSHRYSTDTNKKEKQQPNVSATLSRSASAPIQSAGIECQPIKSYHNQSDDFIAPPKSAPISSSSNLCQPTDLTLSKKCVPSMTSHTEVVRPLNFFENRQTISNIQQNNNKLHCASEKSEVIDLSEEKSTDRRRTEIKVQKELNAALARRQKQEHSSNNQIVAGSVRFRSRQNSSNVHKNSQEGLNGNNLTRPKVNPQKAYLNEVPKNMHGLENSQMPEAVNYDPNTLKKYREQHPIHVPNQNLSALTNAILSPPLNPRSNQMTLPLRYALPGNERGINLPVVIPNEHIENLQNQYAYFQKNIQDIQQHSMHHKHLLHPLQHQQHKGVVQLPSQNQLPNASQHSGIVQLQNTPTKYVENGSFQQFNIQQRQHLQQNMAGFIPGQLRPQTVRLLGVRKEVRYNTPVTDISGSGSNRPILPKTNQSVVNGPQLNLNGQQIHPLTQQQLFLQQQQQLMKDRDGQKIEATESLKRQIVHRTSDVPHQLLNFSNHHSVSTNSQRQKAPADLTQHIQPQNMTVQNISGTIPRLMQVPSSNQNLQYTQVQQTKPMEQHGTNIKNGSLTPLQRAQTQLHSSEAKHVHGSCILCRKYALYLCSGCKQIWYCSPQCQLNHWQSHAGKCKTSSS